MSHNKQNTLKKIELITAEESMYSSWMRNMIILVTAGFAIYNLKDSFKKDMFKIHKKMTIHITELVSLSLILCGLILGIASLFSYYRKVKAITNMNSKDLEYFYFNDRILDNVCMGVTAVYGVVMLLITLYYLFNKI